MGVRASAILQSFHDEPPSGPVTLQWLMGRLGQQSFGITLLILGIAAAAPGVSLLAGFLLLVTSSQMMLGRSELTFPNWVARRELPTAHVDAVMQRAVRVLVKLESVTYPRLLAPSRVIKRVVGCVIFVLTVRLLLAPLPLSNIVPAILIALISLAYLEQDGLLLIGCTLLAGLLVAVEFGAIEHFIQGGEWIMTYA